MSLSKKKKYLNVRPCYRSSNDKSWKPSNHKKPFRLHIFKLVRIKHLVIYHFKSIFPIENICGTFLKFPPKLDSGVKLLCNSSDGFAFEYRHALHDGLCPRLCHKKFLTNLFILGGSIAQWLAYLLPESRPSCPEFESQLWSFFHGKKLCCCCVN